MHSGGNRILRAAVAAAGMLGGMGAVSNAFALTLDFESAAYIHDRTIDMVDGWTRSSLQGGSAENFRTYALGGNKSMRVWTTGVNTLFREMPSNAGQLDLQWRWRANGSLVDACLGVSGGNDNARAAMRSLLCLHPDGRIAAMEVLNDGEVAANATWTPGVPYFMRMRMDIPANRYSVYMATDSLRGNEKLIVGPIRMPGLATSHLTRIVVRSEDGSGTLDIDNIKWETFVPSTPLPVISAQPRDQSILVGQIATLKVAATGSGPLAFQWMRGGVAVTGQKDSIFTKANATLADNGSYACAITNSAGTVNSVAALLTVKFPAPAALPGSTTFADSVVVQVTPPTAAAKVMVSRNNDPFGTLAGNLILRNATSLRAFAVLGGDTSAMGSWEYAKSAAPVVEEPVFTPESGDFPDSLVVAMSAPTPGSVIYYTTDGSVPDDTKPRYTGPIILRSTTKVSAIAVVAGLLPSAVHSRIYVRISIATLGRPEAVPAGGPFGDSVKVTLAPPPSAPSAAVWYKIDTGILLRYQGPFSLHQSATVKAIAILGTVQSDTATWIFTRRLEAPVATPKGRKFPDTLRVSLNTKVADARIHYTVDGRAPDTTSLLYAGPLLLDSTTTLKAAAFKAGMTASEVMTESYELVPDSLFANPRTGDYPSGIFIQLSVTSLRATLYYTLDGSLPGPENPVGLRYTGGIRLDTNATLKAVAIAGQGASLRRGRVLTESYTFISAGVRTLGPGQRIDISSRYSLENPFPGAPSVQIEVIKADSLKPVRGFRDVQFGIQVSLPSGTSAFPEVRLGSPADEERSLYSLSPGGAVQYVSSDDTVVLPGTGTYFMGVDTMPPQITLSGESFIGDATRVLFSIQDNVSSLVLDLERSDDPAQNISSRTLSNPDVVTVTLKAPVAWAPLWVKLRVDDRHNRRHFPADPSAEYLLAQRSAAPLRSPPVFRIGSKADNPWDMVSIPLELDGRLTLGRIKENNSVNSLSAMVWDPALDKPRILRDNEPLEAGLAVWMASPTSVSSLTLPAFQSAARLGKEVYRVKLRKGWNQIANPSLKTLIWPHSRTGLDYLNGQVKGLHGYDPSLLDQGGTGYYHADSLKPWKGDFVLHQGARDTLITLRTSAVPDAPAPRPQTGTLKRGLPGSSRLDLVLGLGRLPVLRLGASPLAADGIGIEDEPQPPARSEKGPKLWSARERARLGTDVLRFHPEALHAWRVVAADAFGNIQDTSAASRGARIEGLDIPEGWLAYAVSRSRGLKFALVAGARILLAPGVADSLDVYAGPAHALAARLAAIPLAVEAFRLAAVPRAGGYSLDISLPFETALTWTLWSLDGRPMDAASLSLAPGFYSLARAGRLGPLPGGMYVLHVDWSGDGGSGRMTRKLALP